MILQAIVTSYLGPTDYRPGRISAKAAAGRLVVNWNPAFSPAANHKAAAEKLANRFGWLDNGAELAGGGLPDNSYCWVLACPAAAVAELRAACKDAVEWVEAAAGTGVLDSHGFADDMRVSARNIRVRAGLPPATRE